MLIKNKFKFKVGDILSLLERNYSSNVYVKVEILEILDKNSYNMYLCRNLKSNCKITFTDKELLKYKVEYIKKGKYIKR
ncbi:MAG: hypothetical protein RSD14_04960 [Clostridia bacterium]